MKHVVLIRHGESQWNLENRFTGWVDVPLSPKGEQEAREAGEKVRAFRFDHAFTSVLTRAIRTLEIVLDVIGQPGLPVEQDQALNERMYGELQGLQQNRNGRKIRRGPGESVAEKLRRAAPRAEKVYRTRPNACCPITGSGCGRDWRKAKRCWWWHTGTACAPSSCTSTGSPAKRCSN